MNINNEEHDLTVVYNDGTLTHTWTVLCSRLYADAVQDLMACTASGLPKYVAVGAEADPESDWREVYVDHGYGVEPEDADEGAGGMSKHPHDGETCTEVYEAEKVLTYGLAGKQLAQNLREAGVDRYAKVTWEAEESDFGPVRGVIDLDRIQADGLATIVQKTLSAS